MDNLSAFSIIGIITGIIGTTTGLTALIWNIINFLKFDLEIYSHYFSVSYKNKASKMVYLILKKDISNYSDNALIFEGFLKLLLRNTGQKFRNHYIHYIIIELKGELKKLVTGISATQDQYIDLWIKKENRKQPLIEGLPLEIEVYSDAMFLKRNWKKIIENPEQIEDKINSLIEKKQYKIEIYLTTYKKPIIYEKGKDNFFYRENIIRKIKNWFNIVF